MWKNWNPCALLVGIQNGIGNMENNKMFFKTLKMELDSYDSPILLCDMCPKKLKPGSWRDIRTSVFRDALFT